MKISEWEKEFDDKLRQILPYTSFSNDFLKGHSQTLQWGGENIYKRIISEFRTLANSLLDEIKFEGKSYKDEKYELRAKLHLINKLRTLFKD